MGLALTTLLNLLIYFNRDRFEYRSYRPPESLYGVCDDACRSDWHQYVKDYPPEELEKARRSLPPPNDGATTLQQVQQLADTLLAQFDGQRGVPTTRLLSLSPFGQYQLLLADSSEKLWCGNWSNIFSWFAWSRGIITRIIEIEKPGDHHVFNECFIPETNSWVMVDLTNRLILPRTPGGQIYNGYQYAQNGPPSAVGAAYFDTGYRWLYYRQYHLGAVYSPTSRIRRYLLPAPWYDISDPGGNRGGNMAFHLKQAGIVLWLIFLLWFGISLLRKPKAANA